MESENCRFNALRHSCTALALLVPRQSQLQPFLSVKLGSRFRDLRQPANHRRVPGAVHSVVSLLFPTLPHEPPSRLPRCAPAQELPTWWHAVSSGSLFPPKPVPPPREIPDRSPPPMVLVRVAA